MTWFFIGIGVGLVVIGGLTIWIIHSMCKSLSDILFGFSRGFM